MRTNLCVLLLGTLFFAVPVQAHKKVIAPPEFAPAPTAAAPMFSPRAKPLGQNRSAWTERVHVAAGDDTHSLCSAAD